MVRHRSVRVPIPGISMGEDPDSNFAKTINPNYDGGDIVDPEEEEEEEVCGY